MGGQVYNMDFCLINTASAVDGAIALDYDVYFYEPDGTYTTQKDVWTDAGKSATHTQPITYNASGFPTSSDVYGQGLYDIKIYDADGNLKRSRRNIGLNNSAIATDLSNLILNASAETDDDADSYPDNWSDNAAAGATFTRDITTSNHGIASFKIAASTTVPAYYESTTFECSPETDYVLSFHIKAGVATDNAKLQIEWLDSSSSQISVSTLYNNSATTPTTWTRIQGLTVTSPAAAVLGKLRLVNNTASATIYFDGIEFTGASTIVSPWLARGLTVSNGTDTDHDLDIAEGEVRDSTNSYNIILSALTKQFDATWAAGDAAGGMESGSSLSANSLYALYAIFNPTTGDSDVMASTSFTSPTLPNGYTAYRRIWAFLTDASSNIRQFIQSGNYCRLLDPFNDVNDSTITADTFETYTMSCPPLALAHIYGRSYNSTSTTTVVYIKTAGTNDGPATYSTEHAWLSSVDSTAGNDTNQNKEGFVLVDSSRQIEAAADEGGGTTVISIIGLGWIDQGLYQ